MTGGTRFFTSLMLLTCVAVVALCEEDGFVGKTACVFPILDLSDAPDQGDRQQTITEMVGLDLKSAGFQLTESDVWRQKADESALKPRDLVSGPAAVSVARAAGADVAVSGYFVLEDGSITVSLQCLETATGLLIAGFQKKEHFNLGFYNLLHAEIAGMLPRIRDGLSPASSLMSTVPKRLTTMAFASPQEGMAVVMGGEKPIGTIQDGRLPFTMDSVAAGTPFTIEKRMPGFHTARQTVGASELMQLTPLARETRFAIEADWTLGQLIGLGGAFRYYPVPDGFFLSSSHYLYFQAPYTPGASGVLHYDIAFLAGIYVIWDPYSEFRLSVSSGAGMIASFFFTGPYPATDFYLDILSVSAEWNLPGISLFFRPEWKYTLGIGNDLLGLSTLRWEVFPPMTMGAMFKW